MNAPRQSGKDFPAKKPDPIDALVGMRLRNFRISAGMTQEALGDKLGVSFQQIQKYERGTNRISCSVLYRFSQILNADITSFFEGGEGSTGQKTSNETTAMPVFSSTSRIDLEVAKLYQSIESEEVRRKLLRMMRVFLEE